MTDLANQNHLATKLTKILTELPAAYEQLFWYWLPGGRPADTGSLQHHSALDTRAPIMLDVLDLTDTRTKHDTDPTRDDYELDRLAGARRQGIIPNLHSWVTRVDAELWDAGQPHGEPADQITIRSECNWLSYHIAWMVNQSWMTDITDDTARMLTDIHKIIGTEKPPKLICTHCGWPVHEITDRANQGGYRCSGCDRIWTRLELHRMAERKRPKTLAEIATMTSISLKTLRGYATRGHLKVVARQGKADLYDLDAVALATMNLKYKRTSVRVA